MSDKINNINSAKDIKSKKMHQKNKDVIKSCAQNEEAEKLQKKHDIEYFSKIFHQTDEKEADALVLKKIFNGEIKLDEDDFIQEILENKDFLNDVSENP